MGKKEKCYVFIAAQSHDLKRTNGGSKAYLQRLDKGQF